MSVIRDSMIKTCYQRATKNRALESRDSSVILIVYQKDNNSRQSLENHAKIDEIKNFSNKKLESGNDLHRALTEAQEYQTI